MSFMSYVAPSHKFSFLLPWVIWGLGALTFFVEYLVRVSPTAMVPSLMESFNASSSDIGTLAAFFLYAYVGMQIPVGILIDRFGAYICLALSTLLCTLSTYLFAATDLFFVAQLSRLLLGVGASFALVGTLKLASAWFKPEKFSILVGTTQALGMIGGAFGAGVMGRMVENYGWKTSTLFFAIVLSVMTLLIIIFVKNGPEKKKTLPPPILPNLKTVFKSPQTWLISIFSGLLFMPTAVFAELWGSFYLTTTNSQFTLTAANDGIGIIFIGWAVGGPLSGALSNRWGRKKIMIYSALLTTILISLILYLPNQTVPMLYALLFLYGLANSGVIATYTAVAEINPKEAAGIALGFANGMSVVVGAFCQQWVGVIIDTLREKRGGIGPTDYLPSELQISMSILVVGALLGLILSFFVKESLQTQKPVRV